MMEAADLSRGPHEAAGQAANRARRGSARRPEARAGAHSRRRPNHEHSGAAASPAAPGQTQALAGLAAAYT